MQDLETSTKACRFEVQFAQATAGAQLVANEQVFAIQAAANGFELGIDGEVLNLGQRLPLLTDSFCEPINQRMNAQGCRTHQGSGTTDWAILPAEWGKPKISSRCQV